MSFGPHGQTKPAPARADFPKPLVIERSLPDYDPAQAEALRAIAESARRLPPPFQRVLDVAESRDGLTVTMERFCGVTGLQLDRGLRDTHRALPLAVWLGIADAWLGAIAAVDPADLTAWATTWHPSQVGVDVTGALMFTFDEHNHVLGHWPSPRVLQSRGTMGPSLPATLNPEQARGRPITPASHVHSLGSALIMLLTGERPFHGESEFSRLQTLIDGQPVWTPRNHPECPPALAEVLHQAIRREPIDRWPDVPSFRAALREAAGVAPAGADPIAGAFFGVRPDRITETFLQLQGDEALLPEAWRSGGLQVMEDKIREVLLPLDGFPENRRAPSIPARAGRPKINLAAPQRPSWWQRMFGGPTSRRGS